MENVFFRLNPIIQFNFLVNFLWSAVKLPPIVSTFISLKLFLSKSILYFFSYNFLWFWRFILFASFIINKKFYWIWVLSLRIFFVVINSTKSNFSGSDFTMCSVNHCQLYLELIISTTVSTVSPSICHEVMGPDAMILVFRMLKANI